MSRKRIPIGSFDVEIDHCDAAALGSCVIENRPALVKGVVAGERVRVRPRFKRRGRLICHLEEVLEPAEIRAEPFCPAFAACGGCSTQHLPREVTVRDREHHVHALLHASHIEVERWLPTFTGPDRHYRHKARLGVRYVPDKGGALVGFREPASNKVAQIGGCGILAESLDRLIAPLRELVASLAQPRSVPQIEVAAGADRAAIVVRHLDSFGPADLARWRELSSRFEVDVYLQSGGPQTVERLAPTAGEELLSYSVAGLTLRFHPMEFTQVNPVVNEALVGAAVSAMGDLSGARVLDLFCGLGNFTLPLAQAGASVLGIEGADELVQRARDNAASTGLAAQFECGDLYAGAAQDALDARWDWLLVDPPRSGCGPLTETIAASPVQRMVYVSCNPVTLASDLETLTASGFRVREAGLFDMFPWTTHIETLAVLERSL